LTKWFLKRRLKCEMLTDGRQTKSDGTKTMSTNNGLHRKLKTGDHHLNPGVNRWSMLFQTSGSYKDFHDRGLLPKKSTEPKVPGG
jgi:hypothetical protein